MTLQCTHRISIIHVEEDNGSGFYMAYMPDYGSTALSAVGATPDDALDALDTHRRVIVQYRADQDLSIPHAKHDMVGILNQWPPKKGCPACMKEWQSRRASQRASKQASKRTTKPASRKAARKG